MKKFRTKYEPGDFSDNEYYKPGTSKTELGQAESMQSLLARMTRPVLGSVVKDATELPDAVVDEYLADSDLDEFETEKTGMAEALEMQAQASELLADAGANSVSGSAQEQSSHIANATASGTQTNSQVPASGSATKPEPEALA